VGSKHQLATTLLLAATLLGRSALAGGPDPVPKPSPTPKPSARSRTARPIALSVHDAVSEVLKAHEHPCERAEREGVPCFPVTVETEGPRFSVAEALRRYRPVGRPAPGGPPTASELQQHLTGAPQSASGGVSFDPGCAMKSLARAFRGGSNTFYLYRLQDARGTRPLLTDHKLSREALAVRPEVRELLGEYSGECEALAAWRKELREQRASEQAASRRAAEEASPITPAPTPLASDEGLP
jgi:hypothetical protein